MVGQISTALAKANITIEDLLSKSSRGVAYTVDPDGPVPDGTIAATRQINGVLALRNFVKPAF